MICHRDYNFGKHENLGMNHICLCRHSWSWYSFTDPRGMGGWVVLGNITSV